MQAKTKNLEPSSYGIHKESCIFCKRFDPLHFECSLDPCIEIPIEQHIKGQHCFEGGADHQIDYWAQRATNAEAFVSDLREFIKHESLRNNLPTKESE